MDGYALAYLIALHVTLGLAVWSRDPARMWGAGIMGSAWLATMVVQATLDQLAAPVVMAVIDVFMVWGFCLISRFGRPWPWLVAGLHVAMLFCHVMYTSGGTLDSFTYLTQLAGLGYCAMLIIGGKPLWALIGTAMENVRGWIHIGRPFPGGVNPQHNDAGQAEEK